MKIDIWSDVRCPFCYIGKHKFEMALAQFTHRDSVTVVWHSFELDPALKTNVTLDASTYLANVKGISQAHVEQMHEHVRKSAESAGVTFNFDKVIVANSFNAHRLIQFAKSKGLAAQAEEALFKAHFAEGKNIDDRNTLIETGKEIGLAIQEVAGMLSTDSYTDEVRNDEIIADNIGINGVPFFVLNNKYGLSGAQPPEIFLAAMQQAWGDYEQTNLVALTVSNDTCGTDGACVRE